MCALMLPPPRLRPPDSLPQAWPTKLQAQAAFQQYDTDGNGGLGPADIAQIAFQVQGKRPPLQQAFEWISKADSNGDELLDFEEFWLLLRHEQALAQAS